jgi:hypothetical protein
MILAAGSLIRQIRQRHMLRYTTSRTFLHPVTLHDWIAIFGHFSAKVNLPVNLQGHGLFY